MPPTLDANLGSATNSATLTTTGAAAPGTRVVLCLWWFEAAGTLSTVIGGGLDWVVDFQDEDASDNHLAFASAYAPGGLESGTVLRPVFSSAVDFGPGMAALSLNDVGASGYVDGLSTPVDDFAEAWSTSGLSTTEAETFCLAISVATGGVGNSNTASTGTELHDFTAEGNNRMATVYSEESSSGAKTLAGTWAVTVSTQLNIAIAYKAGSGPVADDPGVILVKPRLGGGLELGAASGAWTAGSYVALVGADEFPDNDIVILGATWAFADYGIAGADATREWLIEIATGAASSETVKIQIPWMFRMDTAAEHPLKTAVTYFLPEPFLVPAGTRVAVRANNQDVGTQTMNGFHVFYMIEAAGGFVPKVIHHLAA